MYRTGSMSRTNNAKNKISPAFSTKLVVYIPYSRKSFGRSELVQDLSPKSFDKLGIIPKRSELNPRQKSIRGGDIPTFWRGIYEIIMQILMQPHRPFGWPEIITAEREAPKPAATTPVAVSFALNTANTGSYREIRGD